MTLAAMEPTIESVTNNDSAIDLDVNLRVDGLNPNVELETSAILDAATATNLELLEQH